MQASFKLIISDVGHGACMIIFYRFKAIVIDCGFDGSILVLILQFLEVQAVDHVIISHNDIDHIGGLTALLQAFPVHNVYINGGFQKKGLVGQKILEALKLYHLNFSGRGMGFQKAGLGGGWGWSAPARPSGREPGYPLDPP